MQEASKKRIRVAGLVALALLVIAGGGVLVLYRTGLLRFNHPSLERYPVRGVDVSHHQGTIDWDLVRAEGLHFAFIKASEGGDHRDREFERNWAEAGRAGLARGAYHYFTFCSPGLPQAENFLAALGDSPGELPAVADVEFSGNCRGWRSEEEIRTELGVFLRRVEEALGRRPMIYFNRSAHVRLLAGHFDDYPHWPRNIFGTPRGPAWRFWQFADNGRVAGIDAPVDLDLFRGSPAEFVDLLQSALPAAVEADVPGES